jgi:single-strand DNA-binding protein
MAKSVNKVILLGNVGKDPDIRVLPSGQPVANFSIATSERFKDQQGNWQDRTEWHNMTAYGKLAEIVRDYVKKGNKLYAEGRLTTRSWDDKESGKKVYRTEIVVGDISLLSGRGEDGGSTGGGQRGGSSSSFDQRPSGGDDYAHSTEITDDDIPF